MAKMIVEAIEFSGFAFIQALSPCITFCPEQTQWKKIIKPFSEETTGNAAVAAQRIQADDGFSTGIIYKNKRPCWPINQEVTQDKTQQQKALSLLDKEFQI